MSTSLSTARAVCLRYLDLMASGSIEHFRVLVHPEAVNREASDEPPACRGRGPHAFYASAQWLRGAFSELRWEVHRIVAEGDLVAVHCTMSGRHTGTFCDYTSEGRVRTALPATKKRFAATQTLWFRIADGQIIEYWANRDDLAMSTQLGWNTPTPPYLLRMGLAKFWARLTAAR